MQARASDSGRVWELGSPSNKISRFLSFLLQVLLQMAACDAMEEGRLHLANGMQVLEASQGLCANVGNNLLIEGPF